MSRVSNFMDRASISICRINIALNGLLTAGLAEKDLGELEDKIVRLIDSYTGKRTKKILKKHVSDGELEEKSEDKSKNEVKEQAKNNATGDVKETEKTVEKKRVRWDCNTCIQSGCEDMSISMCSLCKKEYEKTGKTNAYYQRKKKDIPECCGVCGYLEWSEEQSKFLCKVNEFNEGIISNNVIRENYRKKNRPAFCKYN